MAKEILKARIEGKAPGDTRLALIINRMYQDGVKSVTENLKRAKSGEQSALGEAAREKTKRQESEAAHLKDRVGSIKWNALKRLILKLFSWASVATVFTLVVVIVYRWVSARSTWEYKDMVNYILAVTPLLLTLWNHAPKLFSEYKNACASATAVASRELKIEQ